jgi:DNA-binding MarR family transcriptional regulator
MQELAMELAHTLQIFPRVKRIAHRESLLTQSEIGVLGCIYRAKRKGRAFITPSEIGRRLAISRPAVTAVINQLLTREAITRAIDEVDKRRVQIALTEVGLELYEQTRQQLVSTMQRILESLGREDGEELVRLLKKTLDIIQEPEFS